MADFYDLIARYYDAENEDKVDDLLFYNEIADEGGTNGGPILDVGTGTGRVALHLAQEGFRVVGLDRSAGMLERARAKLRAAPDLDIEWLETDLLELETDERFPLIIVPYNGFMHLLEQADQIEALRRMRAHLTESGTLLLDLPNPAPAFSAEDDSALTVERFFTDPETGEPVVQLSISTLDRVSQILEVTWFYDAIAEDRTVKRVIAPVVLRYVFLNELDLLLRVAELQRVQVYGDYDRMPFDQYSPRMIVLAQRGAEG
jgi:SAM-dependent methyltransferase